MLINSTSKYVSAYYWTDKKSPEIDKHIELFIRKFREHTYYSMLRRSYDKIHIKIVAGNTWYI